MTKETFLKIVNKKARELRVRGKVKKVTFEPAWFINSIACAKIKYEKEVELLFSQELLSKKFNRSFVEAIIVHELEHIKIKMCDGVEYEQMLREKYPEYGVAIDWAISDGKKTLVKVFGFTPYFYLP